MPKVRTAGTPAGQQREAGVKGTAPASTSPLPRLMWSAAQGRSSGLKSLPMRSVGGLPLELPKCG